MKLIIACLNDLPAIVWAANLANFGIPHISSQNPPAIQRPTSMAFDLDPGAPRGYFELLQGRSSPKKLSLTR